MKEAELVGVRYENCNVEWLEWSAERIANPRMAGPQRYLRSTKVSAYGVPVTIKQRYAIVHLAAGDVCKEIGGRGFHIDFLGTGKGAQK